MRGRVPPPKAGGDMEWWPTTTKEAGPGNPGNSQGTQITGMSMVTTMAAEAEGQGTLSDTMHKQNSSPPLS